MIHGAVYTPKESLPHKLKILPDSESWVIGIFSEHLERFPLIRTLFTDHRAYILKVFSSNLGYTDWSIPGFFQSLQGNSDTKRWLRTRTSFETLPIRGSSIPTIRHHSVYSPAVISWSLASLACAVSSPKMGERIYHCCQSFIWACKVYGMLTKHWLQTEHENGNSWMLASGFKAESAHMIASQCCFVANNAKCWEEGLKVNLSLYLIH